MPVMHLATRAVLLVALALLTVLVSVPTTAYAARPVFRPSASSIAATSRAHKGKVSLAHVTFAGGNRQSSSQAYWDSIIARVIAAQPARLTVAKGGEPASAGPQTDMLLWTGNAVYTDISDSGVELVTPRSPAAIEKEYKVLTENPLYEDFVTRYVANGNVAGVWDEHDMGLRGGAEKNYTQARQVRDTYLRYLLRGRKAIGDQLGSHEGLYYFTSIPAPEGSLLAEVYENAVCVVALDVASLRSSYANLEKQLFRPIPLTGSTYGSATTIEQFNSTSDILGKAQWAWLEGIVKTYVAPRHARGSENHDTGKEACALTIFASAWQVILNDNKPFAGWDLYPDSRSRLLALLRNHKASRFLFVSGHAELAEIGGVIAATEDEVDARSMKRVTALYASTFPITPLTKYSREFLPYPGKLRENVPGRAATGLVEVTSSGLTHSIASAPLVGRFANWLVDGDTSARTLSYRPLEVIRQQTETGSDKLSTSMLAFMPRFLRVGRVVKVQRSFGTLQILTPAPFARKDAWKSLNGGATDSLDALRAFVDEHVVVHVGVHSAQDGSTMLMYESPLHELPSYQREEGEEGERPLDYRQAPPFTIYNVPGEYPSIKRTIVSHGCPELPCVHGKFFMIIMTIFKLFAAFCVLVVLAAVLIGVKLYTDRRDAAKEKLKQD